VSPHTHTLCAVSSFQRAHKVIERPLRFREVGWSSSSKGKQDESLGCFIIKKPECWGVCFWFHSFTCW